MFTAWSEIEYLATKRLQSLVLITTEYGDIFVKHVKQYPFLLEQIVGMAVQVGEKQRERESFGVSVRTRTKSEAVNLFRIYLGLYVGSYVGIKVGRVVGRYVGMQVGRQVGMYGRYVGRQVGR